MRRFLISLTTYLLWLLAFYHWLTGWTWRSYVDVCYRRLGAIIKASLVAVLSDHTISPTLVWPPQARQQTNILCFTTCRLKILVLTVTMSLITRIIRLCNHNRDNARNININNKFAGALLSLHCLGSVWIFRFWHCLCKKNKDRNEWTKNICLAGR